MKQPPRVFIHERKHVEAHILTAARHAGMPLPSGEVIPGEESDFRIENETGILGVELCELMPPPKNQSFTSPIAEESLHKNAARIAE